MAAQRRERDDPVRPGGTHHHEPQSTLASSTPNGTGVLQTVQYRNTGVLLNRQAVDLFG